MILLVRSARPQAGRFQEACTWAKEVGEYVKNNSDFKNIDVFMEMFGDVGTLFWAGDIENLATLERSMDQLNTQEQYTALIRRGVDLLVPGTIHDRILRPV